MTSASERQRKRFGRSRAAAEIRQELFADKPSHGIRVQLWPDAHRYLEADARLNGLSLSAMAHRILRHYYHLPQIP